MQKAFGEGIVPNYLPQSGRSRMSGRQMLPADIRGLRHL
jgi:hypothetical protein